MTYLPSASSGSQPFGWGVNLAGMANDSPHAGTTDYPGIANRDYVTIAHSDVDYFVSKGFNRFRILILWERIQPIVNGALDAAYLGYVTDLVSYITSQNCKALVDIHSFGQRIIRNIDTLSASVTSGATVLTFGSAHGLILTPTLYVVYVDTSGNSQTTKITSLTSNTVTLTSGTTTALPSGQLIGIRDSFGANITPAVFADTWTKLSTQLKIYQGVEYDLMNEPYDCTFSDWTASAQAAIYAIRTVDRGSARIIVNGFHFASTADWVQFNNGLEVIKDPYNNFLFSTHGYFDRDNSGTRSDWAAEVAAGVTTATGTQRLTTVRDWAVGRGVKIHIGEMGTGSQDGFLQALDNTLTFVDANRDIFVAFDYFCGGASYVNYQYGIQPSLDGKDTFQMAVMTKHNGHAQPTTYEITGTPSGASGVASSPFTVLYRGYLASSLTVTFREANGKAGTFLPTSVTLSAGFNPSATFTFTPSTVDLFYLSGTNNRGFTDPSGVYSTQPDLVTSKSQSFNNVLSLRKLKGSYVGPLVRLVRASDNAQQDFGPSSQVVGKFLSASAISAWAGGSAIHVVQIYDQVGTNHAYVAGVNGSIQTDDVPSGSLAPLFVPDGGDGFPVIRFAANGALDANSTINGLTGHTTSTLIKYLSVTNPEMINWTGFPGIHSLGSYGGDAFHSTDGTTTETDLSMVYVAGSWHAYGSRWKGATSNGKQVAKDGSILTSANVTRSSLLITYRDTLHIGWQPYATSHMTLNADWRETLVAGGALTDAEWFAIQNSQTAFLTTG